MASRFIKLKRAVIPVMTAVIMASQLSGCAVFNSNEMVDMINNGDDIVIELAIPDYEINVQGKQVALTRVQLDSLQTYMANGFREDFDKLFGVEPLEVFGKAVSKQGCIYVNNVGFQDGNTSLMDSLRNKVFMDIFAGNEDKLGELGELAYADVEADNYDAVMAALNAYYNIFAEAESGEDDYFNPTQSVTRGEFYSFVYRASNGVDESLTVKSGFEQAVGVTAAEDENVVYASQVESNAWLNTGNTGLRAGNYKQSISRAEAVYMLLNQFMGKDFKDFNASSSSITLGDATDGGLFDSDTDKSMFASNALVDKEGNLVSGYELGALSKMLTAGDGQVQSDLYRALVMAAELGIIDADETRYNEPVSRSEALDMFIKTMEALNESKGYINEAETTGTLPVFVPTDEDKSDLLEGLPELPPVEVFYNKDYDFDGDWTISKEEWEQWCKDHPEDTNKNMTLKDEQEAAQEQQQQTQVPDTSGNPDPGSEETTKPSTSTPSTSKPSTSTPSTSKPSTSTPSTSKPSTSTPSTSGNTSSGNQTTTPDNSTSESGQLTEEEKQQLEDLAEEHGGYYNGHGGLILPGL